MSGFARIGIILALMLPGSGWAACQPFNIVSAAASKQTAGATYTIGIQHIEDVMGTCTPSSFTGTEAVLFSRLYSDPASGSIDPIINSTTVSSNTSVNITYAAGLATLNIRYDDAGLISFDAFHMIGDPLTSFANVFVPADFEITTVSGNPAAASATDAVFKKAGESFSVTVTAKTALGTTAFNYGNESIAEGLKLSSASLVLPSGGRNGTLNDGAIKNATSFSQISPGVFEGTTFAFDEVGIIQLQAEVADGDYLGVGNVVGAASGNVGRFTPHEFIISNQNTPTMSNDHVGCIRAFHYLEEAIVFDTVPTFDLTAVNSDGTTTENYTGAFWKLPAYINGSMLQGNASVGLSEITSNVNGVNIFNLTEVSGGVGMAELEGDTSYRLTIPTASAPIAPFDAEFELQMDLIDSDSIVYAGNPVTYGDSTTPGSGIAFDIAKQIYHGRLAINNSIGSELIARQVDLNLEIYNGVNFSINTADNCTILDDAIITINSSLSPATLPTTITWVAGGFTDMKRVINGVRSLNFSAPNAVGYADIEVFLDNTNSWRALRFDWPYESPTPLDGIYDDSPQARVSFGLFAGDPEVVFEQEVFD